MVTSVFSGSIVALVSPLREGALDEGALRALTAWHVSEGTSALAPAGTTGESATLSEAERRKLVEIVIDEAGGRIPVIAGVGGPSTSATIDKVRHAKAEGAHAGLVVTPYYNRPDQEGLYAHYSAIADAVELPLIVYNVPRRTAVDLSVETLGRLSAHPNIVAVKDASCDIGRVARMITACGPNFALLSGDDPSALGFMAAGGHGVVSVTGNVTPGPMAQMCAAALAGDLAQARALNLLLAPLHDALFAAASPGPTKYALSTLGRCTRELRLPLTEPPAAAREQVDAAMRLALTAMASA